MGNHWARRRAGAHSHGPGSSGAVVLAMGLHILVIEDDETVTVTWTPVAPEATVVGVRLYSGLIGDDSDLLEFQEVTVGVSAILTSISFGSGSTAWASIEAAGYPTVLSAQYVQP